MKKLLILLLPVIAGVLWGSAGVFVRELNEFGMDRYTVLSTRMIVSVAFLLVGLAVWQPSSLRIRLKDLWLFAGTGLLGMLGLNFFYNEAVGEITLSLAAILLSLAPVFVMIISSFVFHEKITGKKINCLVMAIAGCVMASGFIEALSGSGLQVSMWGVAMGILSGFFCALYGIFSKLAAARGYSSLTILFYSLLLCMLAVLPMTDFTVPVDFIAAAPAGNTLFAFAHSACTSVLPYLFYSMALVHMENGKVSILAGGGEPLAAVIFGMLFFMETPTAVNLIGLILTIAALSALCTPDISGKLKAVKRKIWLWQK